MRPTRFIIHQLGFLAAGITAPLYAQSVPATINYQGRLTDNTPSQAPVNATVPMAFAIYDAAGGGTLLWSEPPSGSVAVTVTGGVFSYPLGTASAIPASVFSGANSTRYLQVIINPGPSQEILSPRQLITGTGYANLAQNANSALSANNAATVTNGVYTTGGYSDPAWLTSLSGAKITGGFSAASITSGTLNMARMPAGGAWTLSSNLSLDGNTLVVDQLNNRVGIGIASPGNLLHVEGPGVTAGGAPTASEVVGRFRSTNAGVHSAIAVDALTGQDAVLYLGENGAATWGLRNDSQPSGNFNLRYHGGGANTTMLVVAPTGAVAIPAPGILSIGAGPTTPNEPLEIGSPDATIRIHNTNDTVGSFAGDTYSSLQLGLYNPTGAAANGIPAATKRSFFGIESASGRVGSLTNNFGSPVFRNLLDDGSGYIKPASGLQFADGSIQTTAPAATPRLLTNLPAGNTFTITVDGVSCGCTLASPVEVAKDVVNTSIPTGGYDVMPGNALRIALFLKRPRTNDNTWLTLWNTDQVTSPGHHTTVLTLAYPGSQITWSFSRLRITRYSAQPLPGGTLEERIDFTLDVQSEGVGAYVHTVSGTPPVAALTPGNSLIFRLSGVNRGNVVTEGYFREKIASSLAPVRPVIVCRQSAGADSAMYSWFQTVWNGAVGYDQTIAILHGAQSLYASGNGFPYVYRLKLGEDGLPIEEFYITADYAATF